MFCVLLGSCTCGAGFTGEFCESKCNQGYFGINCEQVCQCEDGHHLSCDSVTGKCICKPEWKGIHNFFFSSCLLKELMKNCQCCCNIIKPAICELSVRILNQYFDFYRIYVLS